MKPTILIIALALPLANCATFNTDLAKAKVDVALVAAKVAKACPAALAGTNAVAGALDPTSQTGQTASQVSTATQTVCAAAAAVNAGN